VLYKKKRKNTVIKHMYCGHMGRLYFSQMYKYISSDEELAISSHLSKTVLFVAPLKSMAILLRTETGKIIQD
jgi:hypothetical protein